MLHNVNSNRYYMRKSMFRLRNYLSLLIWFFLATGSVVNAADTIRDTSLSVLVLGIDYEEVVELLTSDGWETTKAGARLNAKKTDNGDALSIGTEFTEVGKSSPILTTIKYVRTYANSKVDIDVIEQSVIERYGEPDERNSSSGSLSMLYSDGGMPPKTTDFISECEQAGGDFVQVMGAVMEGQWLPKGMEVIDANCSSMLNDYEKAMNSHFSPKLRIYAYTNRNSVDRILSWAWPSIDYSLKLQKEAQEAEDSKPAAQLD